MRASLLKAGLKAFHAAGYDATSIEQVRCSVGVSNGSFFHIFPTKRALAAAIFIEALRGYHRAILATLEDSPSALEGIQGLIAAHLHWVTSQRVQASFLFEQSRAEWLSDVRGEQRAENLELRNRIEAWRGPLVAAGQLRPLPPEIFFSQVIGPAQIFCRAWLSGRNTVDPSAHQSSLFECAALALLTEAALRQIKPRKHG